MENTNNLLYAQAKQSIPGGVNSPVRSFKSVGGDPVFIDRAKGAYLFDTQGKGYVDMICSWGAMILGHGNEDAAALAHEQALKGLSYGAATYLEVEIAEKIKSMMPAIELLRMVNSGTEATMSAIRLARGYTGRNKLVKFNGCYHGHSDCLLAQAGSGVLSMSSPSSPGVPAEIVKDTINLEFNDSNGLEEYFKISGDSTSALIIEPIAGNMNFIPADKEFLQQIRKLCDKHGVVLIFDEVMSGFRVARGGAQEHYGIVPDLVCLGKVIGGGLPVGAFGGRKDIMQHLAPIGSVYQAGTLSGNPLVVTLGLHTLNQLDSYSNNNGDDAYQTLQQSSNAIVDAVHQTAQDKGLKVCAQSLGGMIGIYYGLDKPPRNMLEAQNMEHDLFKKVFHAMLKEGIHLPPSDFEACFVSLAHTSVETEKFKQSFSSFL